MAVILKQGPIPWGNNPYLPAYGFNMVVALESDYDPDIMFYYKAAIRISRYDYDDVPHEIGTFYMVPNPKNIAIFDMRDLFKFMKADGVSLDVQGLSTESIMNATGFTFFPSQYDWKVVAAVSPSDNDARLFREMTHNNACKMLLEIGDTYADSADGEPELTWDDTTYEFNITPQVMQTHEFHPRYVGTGHVQWPPSRGYLTGPFDRCMEDLTKFVNTEDEFVGTIVDIDISTRERYLLSYLRPHQLTNDMPQWYVQYMIFDGDTLVSNDAFNDISDESERFVYGTHIKCGPRDFEDYKKYSVDITAPTDDVEWTHYTIRILDENYLPVSALYRFNNKCVPRPYQRMQLMYQNRVGGWSFQSCNMKSINNLEVESTRVELSSENWMGEGFDFIKPVAHELADLKRKGHYTMTITTDFMSQDEAERLKWSLMTNNPYLLFNNKDLSDELAQALMSIWSFDNIPVQVPIVVENNSFQLKKRIDGLISYQFNVKFSQSIRTPW